MGPRRCASASGGVVETTDCEWLPLVEKIRKCWVNRVTLHTPRCKSKYPSPAPNCENNTVGALQSWSGVLVGLQVVLFSGQVRYDTGMILLGTQQANNIAPHDKSHLLRTLIAYVRDPRGPEIIL